MRQTLRPARAAATLALAELVLLASAAVAQEFRGSINGRITDTSGAVLPGTTVTATNVATNAATTGVTNDDGVYNILYLPPSQYTVTIELQGFKKIVRDGIEVRIGDRLTLDAKLEVGQLEETVSVTTPVACAGVARTRLHLWDISFVKQLRFSERVRGQFHVELRNAFNKAVFNNPNTDPTNAEFGTVTQQNNLPRDIQLAFKIVF